MINLQKLFYCFLLLLSLYKTYYFYFLVNISEIIVIIKNLVALKLSMMNM
jgi:hypothetical protein